MKKKIESDAVVLAAGRQSRYGGQESKLMAKIERHPAFFFTMSSILEAFPEELITIISSNLFQDFNDYVTHSYQKAKLVLDSYPGSGSAQSLKRSMPWQSERVFVTEGNIFYESNLIFQMFEAMNLHESFVGVLAATPNVYVASTHRKVVKNAKLDLSGKESNEKEFLRNVGAYVLSSFFQELINETPDIIEVLNLLNLAGKPILALDYNGSYLHIETTKDISLWQNYFLKNKVN